MLRISDQISFILSNIFCVFQYLAEYVEMEIKQIYHDAIDGSIFILQFSSLFLHFFHLIGELKG